MLKAYSVQTSALVHLPGMEGGHRLERRDGGKDAPWLALAAQGFSGGDAIPAHGAFLDESPMDGICQYRARPFASDSDGAWDYSPWMRRGHAGPVGYMHGNYRAPEGSWGEILTADDLRGYLWGVDFRASNGDSYSDDAIRFFIEAALQEVERLLNITIRKTRVRSEPDRRGLEKGVDYDDAESLYVFRRERMRRRGMIKTKKRPVLSVSRLDLSGPRGPIAALLPRTTVDKTKGLLRFVSGMPGPSDTTRGVEAAIGMHGPDAMARNLFYAIDYDAGFETSDDVPMDLRELVGKKAAVSLMNIIGRGLMAGFSSSSLSMDGVSESFSSTQCATSAFYGADIKEYKDDIEKYIAENRMKFGHVVLGCL
ncbi:MAG: hypothetical protein FWE09_00405 [Treponema sp.]|nr:hypothetical protein [Treponema sp.]